MQGVGNGKIAVLMGGPGPENPVSLRSGRAVAAALRSLGFDVEEIEIACPDFRPPPGLRVAVNMVHGVFGEDGQLQELLERHGIPFTGEGAEGSRLAFDKVLAKRRFADAGVPTPDWEVVRAGERPRRITPPLVLKPPRQGSSVGVEIVREADALDDALRRVGTHDDEILVEAYVEGRELTVGILGTTVLPVILIVPREGFYDFRNKYPWLDPTGGSQHLCPAPIGEESTRRVQDVAMAAHRSLGLEVYSRVDVLLDGSGRPFVLEINTLPGMTEASLLPDAAARAGIGFAELCRRIVDISLERWERRERCR